MLLLSTVVASRIALSKIKNKLPPAPHSIGHSFIELHTVDSTNNYATALVHEGMTQHGVVVFAHQQTKGRGQRNKTWMTGAGENIALSIITQPNGLLLSQLFLLSMATAVGVHHFFSKYAGSQTKVKWPNDLYWNDRKAGGILIENILSGNQWKYAIVGIGININQTHFNGLQRAVSLKQITSSDYNVVALAKDLCASLELAYQELYKDVQSTFNSYHRHLYKSGEEVRLKKGTRVFNATIKGVSFNGQLITHHAVEEYFDVGEVEWII